MVLLARRALSCEKSAYVLQVLGSRVVHFVVGCQASCAEQIFERPGHQRFERQCG